MKYAKIKRYDATNWDGINTVVFFSGCTLNCKGCFNKDIQDFNYGNEYTKEVEDLIVEMASDEHVEGICLLGGEVFEQDLQKILDLVVRLNTEVSKPIHVWSGYKWEELIEDPIKRGILYSVDTLVDGKFDIDKKDLGLKFKGSSNQRVIDTYKSISRDELVLYGEE